MRSHRTWEAGSALKVGGHERGERDTALERAKGVIKSADPLLCVEQAIGEMGYGGDRIPVMLTYLALTSRVLAIRHGQMPVHLLITGPPSAGKSYTLQTALRLFPAGTCHTIDAGSPRVILYWEKDLQHRAVIFSEADSIPAGEDNPAASALRGLLQDHRLHYQYVDRNARAGDPKVIVIDKPGPTVLVTTSTKPLGPQLASRMFVLDVGDDVERVRATLRAQAAIELHGTQAPDDAVCAYQEVLQEGTPWKVIVPFAEVLAEAMGRGALPSRISRDFSRLLSLIKTVTVIRFSRRQRDANGNLVAELDDYEYVYRLLAEVYASTVTGIPETVRRTVEAVRATHSRTGQAATYADIARELGVIEPTAEKYAARATERRWLANDKLGKGRPAALRIGEEEMPPQNALPEPESLRAGMGNRVDATTEEGA